MSDLKDAGPRATLACLTRTLRGHFDADVDPANLIVPFRFFPCFCVQDSPDNPCPCGRLVIWILDDPAQVDRVPDQSGGGSAPLYQLRLPRDVKVCVETQAPVTLDDLEQLAVWTHRATSEFVIFKIPQHVRASLDAVSTATHEDLFAGLLGAGPAARPLAAYLARELAAGTEGLR